MTDWTSEEARKTQFSSSGGLPPAALAFRFHRGEERIAARRLFLAPVP